MSNLFAKDFLPFTLNGHYSVEMNGASPIQTDIVLRQHSLVLVTHSDIKPLSDLFPRMLVWETVCGETCRNWLSPSRHNVSYCYSFCPPCCEMVWLPVFVSHPYQDRLSLCDTPNRNIILKSEYEHFPVTFSAYLMVDQLNTPDVTKWATLSTFDLFPALIGQQSIAHAFSSSCLSRSEL